MFSKLFCAGKLLDLSRPLVMGILNVTPDSFSDGGNYFSTDLAIDHALRMVDQGADIIDVGGESTRPGAQAVSEQEELDRVLPVVKALAMDLPIPVSIDTSKPVVMRAAVEAGAGMINDVRALRFPGALDAVSEMDVPVCLMHMQGQPINMQNSPHYKDVVSEVKEFLANRVKYCVAAGIAHDRLVVDPGFGFGKTLTDNLNLLSNLEKICTLGLPVLVGLSRKSMIGSLLNRPVEERLFGSLSAAMISVLKGATILRVHDVRPTVEALAVVNAMRQYQQSAMIAGF